MTGWLPYLAAWTLFLGSHAVPVRPAVRGYLVAILGTTGFVLVYGAVSLAALAFLIVAARSAPFVPVWDFAEWHRPFAQGAMLLAVGLSALAALTPNPLSFGGWRNRDFDPVRPGLVGWVRHPMLAALALWSVGHLPVNGDLAHVLMFGGFTAFALLGMGMIDRRRRRDLGEARWRALASGRGSLPPSWPVRLVAAAALWAALAWLHPWLVGPVAWP
jgi:uncharacterized membrane protein